MNVLAMLFVEPGDNASLVSLLKQVVVSKTTATLSKVSEEREEDTGKQLKLDYFSFIKLMLDALNR